MVNMSMATQGRMVTDWRAVKSIGELGAMPIGERGITYDYWREWMRAQDKLTQDKEKTCN